MYVVFISESARYHVMYEKMYFVKADTEIEAKEKFLRTFHGEEYEKIYEAYDIESVEEMWEFTDGEERTLYIVEVPDHDEEVQLF